ncbi:PDGLE domain-containing protein [Myxococcota bacterium]|nr:PDGLE domain-containing protein [Myxococcota bacterium]MBU1534121.1 PDGLE domain-containing protein [Myxococcota bacterium]
MASDSPDGLERTAKDSGFIARAKEGKGPFREYSFPGISQAKASTALSGLTGTLLAFMTVFLLATLLKRKTPSPKSGDPTRPSEGKSS